MFSSFICPCLPAPLSTGRPVRDLVHTMPQVESSVKRKLFHKWNPLRYGSGTDMDPHCCTPTAAHARSPRSPARPAQAGTHTIEQCQVPAQAFAMGDHHGDGLPFDGEGPIHRVQLDAFEIDATSVANADFRRFVAATGYVTDAERFGTSAVFHLAVAAPRSAIHGPVAAAPWWLSVAGADWAHPDGPDSDLDGREDHPVVHVSHA